MNIISNTKSSKCSSNEPTKFCSHLRFVWRNWETWPTLALSLTVNVLDMRQVQGVDTIIIMRPLLSHEHSGDDKKLGWKLSISTGDTEPYRPTDQHRGWSPRCCLCSSVPLSPSASSLCRPPRLKPRPGLTEVWSLWTPPTFSRYFSQEPPSLRVTSLGTWNPTIRRVTGDTDRGSPMTIMLLLTRLGGFPLQVIKSEILFEIIQELIFRWRIFLSQPSCGLQLPGLW